MAGGNSGATGGNRPGVDLALGDIFSRSKDPAAGSINLIVHTNQDELVIQTMQFDPNTAHHFRTHPVLNGRELDPEKLKKAGVENVNSNATYYSFPDFSRAVVQDYNLAVSGATKVYNSVVRELGYGDSETLSASKPVKGIADINAFTGWDTLERMLEGAQRSAARTPDFNEDNRALVGQIGPAITALQSGGANARALSEYHFQEVKPLAPGLEVEPFDYNSLLAAPVAGTSGTSSGPKVK